MMSVDSRTAAKFITVVAVVVGHITSAAEPQITIVNDGKPKAVLVLPVRPTESAQLAAFELQHHVKLLTGAVLPIVSEVDAASARTLGIFIGDTKAAQRKNFDSSGLKPQEFVCAATPTGVYLTGHDEQEFQRVVYDMEHFAANTNWPGYWHSRGSCDAVYEFLEELCGVRWLDATDTGTYVPETKTLSVSTAYLRRSPTFEYRCTDTWALPETYVADDTMWPPGSDGMKDYLTVAYPAIAERYNDPSQSTVAMRFQVRAFLYRHRAGGRKMICNHAFYGYYGRFWQKPENNPETFVERRPDYFAHGYKGQPPQLCYTSPALIAQVIKDTREYYEGKVDHVDLRTGSWLTPPNPFAVELMDNEKVCRCEQCQAQIQTDRSSLGFSSGEASDYWFGFVNRVAEDLAATHPDRVLMTLAYARHAEPPSFPLQSNVVVQFCFSVHGLFNYEEYANELKWLHEWAADAHNRNQKVYLWLYYCSPRQFAPGQIFPPYFAHTIDRQMKLFAQLGYDGMFHCGFGPAVDSYVSWELMDDATQNVDTLLDEYFTGLYSESAQPMKQMYLEIERAYAGHPGRFLHGRKIGWREKSWQVIGNRVVVDRLNALFAEAVAMAETDRTRRNLELFRLGTLKNIHRNRE